MRLTAWLLRRNRMPNGNIFGGKHRLVREVKPVAMRRKQEEYAVEENNMLLLRYPYLTEEQSFGHAKALNKHEKFVHKWTIKKMKFKEDVTLRDRFWGLAKSERWD